ncbi:hypothetical protein ASU33_12525 [Solirubrum puertoriconensis]|uniref:Uncharacterized protein n=1 Tax=Solirubrum puertoriconensis TaxID=1751427 RepID=A0A9X0L443_SOLP1|nr:hypothetical protein ASU33_12525 [Solirubrum puertoriconensis]
MFLYDGEGPFGGAEAVGATGAVGVETVVESIEKEKKVPVLWTTTGQLRRHHNTLQFSFLVLICG